MNNKIVLESMAMDLKRVALGYHTKSLTMARRFHEEAVKRKNEIDTTQIKPYLYPILEKIVTIQNQNHERIAEDALMFSVLIQNYVRKFLA